MVMGESCTYDRKMLAFGEWGCRRCSHIDAFGIANFARSSARSGSCMQMDVVTADQQSHTPNAVKEDVQEKMEEAEASPARPLAMVEGANPQLLLTWTAAVRLLADLEAAPAAIIAAVAVVIVLSLFGRVGSLVMGLVCGLLIHAAIERKRDTIQWPARASFTPDASPGHVREVPHPPFALLRKAVVVA